MMRVLLDVMKQTHFFEHSASALVEFVFVSGQTIIEKVLLCNVS